MIVHGREPSRGRCLLKRQEVIAMFFAGLLDLIRSLVDLMRVIIETHESRRRDMYHPRHLASRRGGTTQKKSR